MAFTFPMECRNGHTLNARFFMEFKPHDKMKVYFYPMK